MILYRKYTGVHDSKFTARGYTKGPTEHLKLYVDSVEYKDETATEVPARAPLLN